MTAEFYDRLKKYYTAVGTVLRGEADVASIFPNATDIGMSRERVYAEFLRSHLPSNCNVLFGGFLFNLDGVESKQIDLIVISDCCPQFNFADILGGHGKTFACIEGTVAAVSLKSNLTSAELRDVLENLASIPPKEPLGNRKMPLMKIPDYEEWPFKIIYAPNGVSLETLLMSIEDFYEANPSIPITRRPNLIHVAGKYNVIRTLEEGGETRNGTKIPPNVFYGQPDPTDVYGLAIAIEQIQKKALAAQHILFTYEKILQNIPF